MGSSTGAPGALFNYDAKAWGREPVAAFDEFLAGHRSNGRALRPSSFAVYRGMFLRLTDWLSADGLTVHDLEAGNLEDFLSSRHLAGETRHRYLLAFTELYQHLAIIRDAEGNPARELLTAAPAPDRLAPEALVPTEVVRSLDLLRAQEATGWKDRRLEAMFCLLLGAGLRTTELLALRPQDVARESSVWVKPHKPRPERTVPLEALAAHAMRDWLSVRHRELAHVPGALLFPGNERGAPLTASTLFRQVQGLLAAAGVSRRYEGPMLLRNTRAAVWLARHPAPVVRPWLGHQHLRTTEELLPLSVPWASRRRLLDQPLYPRGRPQPQSQSQSQQAD